MCYGNYFTEQFNISEMRFQMLFSLENVYGVFVPRRFITDYNESSYYDLTGFSIHSATSPVEVLKDVIFSVNSGEMEFPNGSVLCIRLNGYLKSYRYIGNGRSANISTADFIPISGFLDKETTVLLDKLHSSDDVLSVLDGRILSLTEISGRGYMPYAIEKECFLTDRKKEEMVFNFSLYRYNHGSVAPAFGRFVSLSNALFCFRKNCRESVSSVLLYSRHELNMIRDYSSLNLLGAVSG